MSETVTSQSSKPELLRARLAPSLCLLLGALSMSASSASEQLTSQQAQYGEQQRYNFSVSLDNKPIGFHKFSFQADGERLSIESQAAFDVKFLFINAFRYRHNSQESWQKNCVSALDAKTNSNGKQQDVQGWRTGSSFKLNSALGPDEVGGCVQTFAYWNPKILEASALLNMQTGEYVPIEITPLGDEILPLADGEYMTKKYKLRSAAEFSGKPVDITLWYAKDNMQWLALESIAKGKRKLRYKLNDASDVIHNSMAAMGAEK